MWNATVISKSLIFLHFPESQDNSLPISICISVSEILREVKKGLFKDSLLSCGFRNGGVLVSLLYVCLGCEVYIAMLGFLASELRSSLLQCLKCSGQEITK